MKDKIFDLLNNISSPIIVLNCNKDIIFFNTYFKDYFNLDYILDIQTISAFNKEWEKFHTIENLIILNKSNQLSLNFIFISEFCDLDDNTQNYGIYNLHLS